MAVIRALLQAHDGLDGLAACLGEAEVIRAALNRMARLIPAVPIDCMGPGLAHAIDQLPNQAAMKVVDGKADGAGIRQDFLQKRTRLRVHP